MLLCGQQRSQAGQQVALPTVGASHSNGIATNVTTESGINTPYAEFHGHLYGPSIDTDQQHQLTHLQQVDTLLSSDNAIQHQQHHSQQLIQQQSSFTQHQQHHQQLFDNHYAAYPDDLQHHSHHFKLESRSPSSSGEEEFQLPVGMRHQQQFELQNIFQQQQQQQQHQMLQYSQFSSFSSFCPAQDQHQHIPEMYFSDFSSIQQQQQQQFAVPTVHQHMPPPLPPPPPSQQPQLLPLPLPPQVLQSDPDTADSNPAGVLSNNATEDERNSPEVALASSAEPGPTDCLVCGDSAACQHYGVRTCEGCKGFFKRTIQKNAQYVCLHTKNCVVDKRRRNRCQYCRFKKCLRVGMVKEVVRSESLKGRRGRLSSKARQQQQQQPSQVAHLQLPAFHLSSQAAVMDQSQLTRSRPSAGCGGVGGGTPVTLLSVLISAHLSTQPPATALSNSASTPSSTDGVDIALDDVDLDEDVNSEAIRLCSAIDASLTVVEQFANQLPGFTSLEHCDRAALLRAHAIDVVLARAAYRSEIPDMDSIEDNQSNQEATGRSNRRFYFRFDSGDKFSWRSLARLGLGPTAEALANCGRQLKTLMDKDCAAFAGLATILLVYFSPDEEKLSLARPGEVYKLHHNYIEMLKSHCCSGAAKRDSTFLSRVLQQKSVVRSVTRQFLIPSLLSHLGNRLSPRLLDMCSNFSSFSSNQLAWKHRCDEVDVIDVAEVSSAKRHRLDDVSYVAHWQ